MESLADLVARMEAAYPRVMHKDGYSSRAETAAGYVRCKTVKFLGYQGGADYWQIHEATASIAAGTCTCNDIHAPQDAKGGKLCSHRIAAQFQKILGKENGIAAVLLSCPPELNELVLFVDVLYIDAAPGRQYTLGGHRMQGRTIYEYDQRVTFTEAEFNAACRSCGWGMNQKPSRQKGMLYYYFLRRGIGLEVGLNGLAAQDAERIEQRSTMKQLFVTDEMMREEIAG